MRAYSTFTTGLTDLQYKVFDSYGYPLTEWSGSSVSEDGGTPGLYYTDIYGLTGNASVVRWRRSGDHTVKQVVPLYKLPLNPAKEGIQKSSNDDFSYLLDTRNYRNGPASLLVYALGSDGLWAKATRSFIILNDLARTTYYKSFPYTGQVDNNILQATFGLDSFKLSANPQRRGWLQVGYNSTGAGVLEDDSTMLEAEAWWAEYTLLPIVRKNSWALSDDEVTLVPSAVVDDMVLSQLSAELSVDTTEDTTENPVKNMWVGVKITPFETMNAFDLNADGVLYIDKVADDSYFLYTYGPAKVLKYSKTGITQIRDFSTFESDTLSVYGWAGNITKITRVDSEYYLVIVKYYDDTNSIYVSKLLQVYQDTNKKPFELIPFGEQSDNIYDVVTAGEKAVALYFDTGTLTLTAYDAYSLGLSWSKVFEQAPTIKRIASSGKLALFDGVKLYVSEDGGVTEPVLEPFSTDLDDFPADLSAVGRSYVALANGDVYVKDVTTGNYSLVVASASLTSPVSITDAAIGADTLRLFVSFADSQNTLETNLDGTWSERGVVSASADENSYTQLSELYHYSEEVDPGSGGSIDDPTFVPPIMDDRLLIVGQDDTDGNSKLFVLQKADLDENSGAVLVSKIAYPTIIASRLS